jgi:hypothetical protein
MTAMADTRDRALISVFVLERATGRVTESSPYCQPALSVREAVRSRLLQTLTWRFPAIRLGYVDRCSMLAPVFNSLTLSPTLIASVTKRHTYERAIAGATRCATI